MTDAAVSPWSLQWARTYAIERSFNSISIDGGMSTNDTNVVLANGAAAPSHPSAITVEEIDEESDKERYEIFKEELMAYAADIAKLVMMDGEGVTKFVTVTVDVSIRVLMFGDVILIVL